MQPNLLSQLSTVHGLLSAHSAGKLLQLPNLQTPPTVQASPSSQGALMSGVYLQPPLPQSSSVHGLLSSHSPGLTILQTPAKHFAVEQTLPPLQTALLKVFWQPSVASQ